MKWLLISCCVLTVFTATAQDNNLQFYLDSGLEASPLLKDYQNQISANAIDSAKIRAGYKPQVIASSTNSYAPVIKGWGYDEAITNGRNINAVVGVNKVFAGRKNLESQFESISLLNQGIENNKKMTEQELKRTITAQYITVYGDKQQCDFLNESFLLLKDEDEVLKKLTQNNVYRQTDYLTFLVTLQQQDIARSQSAIQLQNDLATLNYLCGIVDTAQVNLIEPDISLTQYPAREQSVFFRQYRIDSLSLINKRLLIDFNYKPKLSAFADAGYNSSLAITPYKNFGYNFGFTLSIPIYDGHQRKMEYRKLDLAEQTRSNYLDFFSRQYNQQMIQYRQQLRSTEELIFQMSDQIKYSEALIKAHTKLLSTGDVKIADLVIAINNYLTIRNQLTQYKIARWQIINQINYWNR
ncbi:TolC family protein [Taibaiella lutea]|uniref:TolC family protein n=1 Tax=Taibaiella lutea TaxID=2608001 RepID=A0A5M6CMI8_9BACT|nr:TolC family protein [Taibaiella lutea]KAA5534525.1 TolC family protein [Taibaiella lutea]